MNREYEELKEFWDKNFDGLQAEEIKEEYIKEPSFINMVDKYLPKDKEFAFLDYGCGTGWLIFDLHYRFKIEEGLGLDTSLNAINYCNDCKQKSNIYNLHFLNRDQNVLDNFENHFDYAMSVNTLDVIPDSVIREILSQIKFSLKKGAYFIVCLNPVFKEEEMINLLKMNKKDNMYYKDKVLRCNYKDKDEWIDLFKEYFEFVEYTNFKIDQEKYLRQAFVLKK